MTPNDSNKSKKLKDEAFQALKELRDILWSRYTKGKENTPRVVVVVGAGASRSSGLPTWDVLRSKLLAAIAARLEANPDYVQAFWMTFAPTIGPWDPALKANAARTRLLAMVPPEAILSAACHYDSLYRILRGVLQEELSGAGSDRDELREPRPQLTYEMLAHMMKHGFIDDAVSFNFDSLFERALENELGVGEFLLLVSDNQLPPTPSDDDAKRGPRNPRLLKVHGSIDSPRSLRFTPETTGVLSSDLEALLTDSVLVEPSLISSPPKKVDIVSLGYSWQDRGFANWIVSHSNQVNSITVVEVGASAVARLGDLFGNVPNKPILRGIDVYALIDDEKCREAFEVDHFLWGLWEGLVAKSKDTRTLGSEEAQSNERTTSSEFLMPAARHLLLAYWFGGRSRNTDGKLGRVPHTAVKRFTAEFLLHMAKCKGMVVVSVMADIPRIHRYYRALVKSLGGRAMLRECFKAYAKRDQYAEVLETLFSTATKKEELVNQLQEFGSTNPLDPIPLLCPLWRNESAIEFALESDAEFHKDKVQEWVREIFNAPEVEVDSDTDKKNEWLFRNCKPLRGYFELQRATRELLERPDWTHLLCIAESGEWLTKRGVEEFVHPSPERGQLPKILLISSSIRELADQWPIGKKLHDEVENQPRANLVVARLPWWQHNRHLTAVLRAAPNEAPEFLGGIYFRRHHKASRIVPVVISSDLENSKLSDDTFELLMTFLSYVRRTLGWTRQQAGALLPATPGQPRATQEELVAMIQDANSAIAIAQETRSVFVKLDDIRLTDEMTERLKRVIVRICRESKALEEVVQRLDA